MKDLRDLKDLTMHDVKPINDEETTWRESERKRERVVGVRGEGLGCGIQGLGVRSWGLGFWVKARCLGVWDLWRERERERESGRGDG